MKSPTLKFISGAVVADSSLGERQIRVIASDATVDRVGDVMVPKGCVLDDYLKNDVVLADHDGTKPIGNAAIDISDTRVEAVITFAPKGISAIADERCGLYKAGVLKAVSVGFHPIEWEPIKDGGFRYIKWALMELSCVAVPCNPNAITIERSLEQHMPQPGQKAANWKVGASRNLPIDKDSAWDGAAAEESIWKAYGFDDASPDTAKARKAFLFYDAANPKKKGSYKEPFAKVVGGRLVAVAAGIRAAASRLSSVEGIPDDVKKSGGAVIDSYEEKMKADDGKSAPRSVEYGKAGKIKVKGLYECAELARVLMNLGFIHQGSAWEAEVEQDGSKLPALLASVLRDCAEALVAMTQEEVNELLSGHGVEVLPFDEDYIAMAATPQGKAIRAAFCKAGRVLSQENLDHLKEIGKCLKGMDECSEKAADLHDDLHDTMVDWMDHGTSLGDHVKAMLKSTKKPNDQDDDSDADSSDVADPSNADQELAAQAAARKRQVEVMERSAA